MKNLKIFLVEGDAVFGKMINYHLSLNPNYEVHLFKNSKECLSKLYLRPNIICLDYDLSDMKGDVLIQKIKETCNDVSIIILSGQEDIDVVVKFFKLGVDDYIIKNENSKEALWNSILKIKNDIVLNTEDAKENFKINDALKKTIIGQSAAINETFLKVKKAVKTNINVSITGETGTGKEVVARAIHFHSDRRNKPFVAINMAAIPKELLESEFFGYEKGAFTGAVSKSAGKFEQANGGTIFLDEIAEMDISLQSKLLRVIQEREVVRIGGNQKIKLDSRLIIATHKNLAEEVKKGNFREDLYYRIIGLPIHLPPLRERGQDILILAKYFIDSFVKENKMNPLSLSSKAQEKLLRYKFPGNIRELKSIMDLACVMAENEVILPEDLQINQIGLHHDISFFSGKTLKEHTTEIILNCLKNNNDDIKKTARSLNIGKSTIYNLLQTLEKKHS